MKLVPKMGEAAEHHGSSRHADSIFEVMDALAERMKNKNPEEHLIKKLTMSWKRTDADAQVPNPFMIARALDYTDAMAVDLEDELELAMQLVDDNALQELEPDSPGKWAPLRNYREWEQAAAVAQSSTADSNIPSLNSVDQVSTGSAAKTCGLVLSQSSSGASEVEVEEPIIEPTSPPDPQMVKRRARGRWKWAFMKMRMAIAIMRATRKKRFQDEEDVGPIIDKTSTGRGSIAYTRAMERQVRDDEASMVEIHQTVINAAKATLKSMIEARSLTADSYSILYQGLNVQEEHISDVVDGSQRLSSIADESDHLELLSHCFSAAWGSIRATIFRPRTFIFWLASKLVRVDNWLEACWCLHKRDIEVVAAFIFTQDHLMEDLEILEDFEDEVIKPMKQVAQQAKKEALRGFVHRPHDCGMFILFEHILLARLIMRTQFHLLEHLAHDGILAAEDVEHLVKHVLSPTEYAVTKYVPSIEQLRKLGSPKVADYNANYLKSFLMKFIIELEFHEEDMD